MSAYIKAFDTFSKIAKRTCHNLVTKVLRYLVVVGDIYGYLNTHKKHDIVLNKKSYFKGISKARDSNFKCIKTVKKHTKKITALQQCILIII